MIMLNPGDSVAYTASAAPGYELAAGAQSSFVYANTFDTSTCNVTPKAPQGKQDNGNPLRGLFTVTPIKTVDAQATTPAIETQAVEDNPF